MSLCPENVSKYNIVIKSFQEKKEKKSVNDWRMENG